MAHLYEYCAWEQLDVAWMDVVILFLGFRTTLVIASSLPSLSILSSEHELGLVGIARYQKSLERYRQPKHEWPLLWNNCKKNPKNCFLFYLFGWGRGWVSSKRSEKIVVGKFLCLKVCDEFSNEESHTTNCRRRRILACERQKVPTFIPEGRNRGRTVNIT